MIVYGSSCLIYRYGSSDQSEEPCSRGERDMAVLIDRSLPSGFAGPAGCWAWGVGSGEASVGRGKESLTGDEIFW